MAEIGWEGEGGYAPRLLGLVAREQNGCRNIDRKWGCCGAAGGYPAVEPEGAATLASQFDLRKDQPLPGLCLVHLAAHDRQGWPSDWQAP